MKALIILLALAVAAGLWMAQENRQLTQALSEATLTANQQKKDLSASRALLTEWQTQARRSERAQALLRQQRDAAEALATHRNQTIMRLLNENEDLRRWYQSPLPDAIARLHQRPAFTNPDDYLRWLSASQFVPDTGEPPNHQRGIK